MPGADAEAECASKLCRGIRRGDRAHIARLTRELRASERAGEEARRRARALAEQVARLTEALREAEEGRQRMILRAEGQDPDGAWTGTTRDGRKLKVRPSDGRAVIGRMTDAGPVVLARGKQLGTDIVDIEIVDGTERDGRDLRMWFRAQFE